MERGKKVTEVIKELEQGNARLRKAISDLTLEKMILQEAAKGNFLAPNVVVGVSRR